ncbi:MOB kinase activator-like 2 isoform X2 [Anopheles darlingi]|uniref:MOB kinase activator-like 2 isoform X2 n=1 Tax=Anopheles darlingi TaxID=43151 RepID=UPI0020FFFFDA|nr:MOB kinase activator-like 2 isoform X2 [Anopheles darlingi]XP_049543217.1 MOB kinase activator-like 2 isoform X2 [Anopheles darlingi]
MLRSPAHLIGHGPGPGGGGVMGLHSHASSPPHARPSLFDSCHRKIRLIGGGPVAFLGGLVAKARRKERDGDSNQGDTKLYLEEGLLERKLPDADLRLLVDLPAGLDYNEWLASHTLALFEHVNLVYGTISEFCTTSGCPDMTGPGTRMYLWFDEKGKKTRVAAPQYIDYVMTFTQKTVSDESIFPTKYANEFPSSFESIARKIVRLLFHVIAHLYAAHFREVALLGLHAHLNLTFAHLTAFHRRYNLIESKETEVLRDLEIALRLTDDPTAAVDKDSSASIVSTTVSSSSSSSTGATNANSNSNHNATICSSSSNSSTASSSPPLLLPGSATNQATGGGAGAHTNNACSSSSSPNIGRCAENNNSSSSDNVPPFGAGATLIDGDATAQPICKQPLESGGSSCVVNSCSNHHHPPGSGAGGNPILGGKDQQQHHHHQHMMMQSSCGGSGSSTGSVGVVGCGVGYSVVAGSGGGGGGGTGAGGAGSASAANAQPTA